MEDAPPSWRLPPAPDKVRCRCVMKDLDDGPERCASRATQEDGLCDSCRKGCVMARMVKAYDEDEVVVHTSGWVHMAEGDWA